MEGASQYAHCVQGGKVPPNNAFRGAKPLGLGYSVSVLLVGFPRSVSVARRSDLVGYYARDLIGPVRSALRIRRRMCVATTHPTLLREAVHGGLRWPRSWDDVESPASEY